VEGPSVVLHPDAVAEAIAAADWYRERSPAAANAFCDELDRAITAIASHPMRWSSYVKGTRRFVLRRFPYSVVYRAGTDGIQVLAIAHARRRPGYWRKR